MSDRVNRCSVSRNFRNSAAPVCNGRSRAARKGTMSVICAEGGDLQRKLERVSHFILHYSVRYSEAL